MEFEIGAFAKSLQELFVNSQFFPYLDEKYINKYGWTQTDRSKHPKREPLHLRKAVDDCMSETYLNVGENIVEMTIGSEKLERTHPYYHILEDAPVIRKANKGTEKTKGSQAKVEDVGQRDYGRVHWNGKVFAKEYAKNVRGSRDRTSKVSHWTNSGGRRVFVNRESNAYKNEHYKYIERILDSGILETLASQYGLKMRKRKIDTGLGEEYALQEESNYTTNIIDILDSFE